MVQEEEPKPEEKIRMRFGGQYLNFQGTADQASSLLGILMGMNDYNQTRIYPSFKRQIERGDWQMNGDILDQAGNMIRLNGSGYGDNIEINLGGGGNSTPPEIMKKSVQDAGVEIEDKN